MIDKYSAMVYNIITSKQKNTLEDVKMKRAKQVEKMIERCNEYLKNCYVTNESDDVFHMTCEMLLAAG